MVLEVATNREKHLRAVFGIVFALILACLIFPDSAYATSYFSGIDETGRQFDASSFADGMHQVYNIARVAAIALAAVAAAAGALQMLGGNEDAVAKGKAQIAIAVMVIVAIALLPTVVKFGVDVGRQYGWTPTIEEGNQFDTTVVTDSEDEEEIKDDEKN